MRKRQALIWAVVLILAAIVFGRAAWVASHTEGGWEILREHLMAGVPPVLHVGDYRDDEPSIRESTWIFEQAEKVASAPKATADDLMGAALVSGAYYGWTEMPNTLSIGVAMWRPLPHPDVNLRQWIDEHVELNKLSRGLLAKATQREPERLDLWRLRVVLENTVIQGERDSECVRNASQRDPENALYEYVFGFDCYYRAWKTRDNGDSYIADQELFRQAKEHYEKALAKSLLAMGEPATTAAGRFLSRADGAMSFKMGCYPLTAFDIARSHLVSNIECSNLFELQPLAPTDEVAAWFVQQNNRANWLRQWRTSGETAWYEIASRPWGNALPLSMAPLISALQGWQNQQWWNRSKEDQYKIWSVVGVAAAAVAAVFLILALVSYLAARCWGRGIADNPPIVGFCRTVALWLLAFIPTFVILGVLPTFKPRFADYHWSVAVACMSVLAAIVGWPFWTAARFVFRQGRLPRQQRAKNFQLVRWSLVVALSAVFVIVMQTAIDRRARQWTTSFFDDFPGRIVGEVEKMRVAPNSDAWLSSQVGVVNETWPWATVQWGAHWGLFWTTTIWSLLMTAFGFCRPANGPPPLEFADCLKPFSKAALALSLIFVLISVASTTEWTIRLRQRYEQKLARLADPGWLVKQVEAEVQNQQEELQLER